MKNSTKKFKLCRFLFETTKGGVIERFMITENQIPMLELNQWLESKAIKNQKTGKEYGSKLVVYLNFLDTINKNYENATYSDVIRFIRYLLYGDFKDLTIIPIEMQLSYSTFRTYLVVITEVYKWLDINYQTNMKFQIKNNYKKAEKSFLYGQIYSYDYQYIVDAYLPHLKSGREYIKWYDDIEKEKICSNFITLRDKVVFLLTLEGFRIDEVLSMQLQHYNSVERLIQPSRSKGKPDARSFNILRVVALPQKTAELLDQYILTERMIAENESGNISQNIFINLNNGLNQGKPLTYRNYWECLKRCAKRAGIDSRKIRTHSGRSTKVMEYLEHQALYPQDGITDSIIMECFGWKNSESIESYRNHNNPIIAREVMKKLHKKVGDQND